MGWGGTDTLPVRIVAKSEDIKGTAMAGTEFYFFGAFAGALATVEFYRH